MKYSSRAGQQRLHAGQQRLLRFDGEAIAPHLLGRGVGQGEAGDLVVRPRLDPMDAPVVDVPFAVVLVDDALHGGVVVDPGHADVVAHDQVDLLRRDLQRLGQDGAWSAGGTT